MTYLVTGGMGVNASQVVRELVKRGKRPIIYDIVPDPKLIKDILGKVKIIRGDITDFHQLLHTIKTENVDRIIHLAYLVEAAEPSIAFRVNLVGTFNLFEAARILDVKRFTWTSSWQVYGDAVSEMPMQEECPKMPKDIYGAGKIALEIWGEDYAMAYGMDITALRFSRLYGPGRPYSTNPGREIDLMILDAVYGKPSRIAAGDEKIQLLYLKDMANAILLADSRRRPKHKVFNIGSEECFSVKDIARLIKRLIPSSDIKIIPKKEKRPSRYLDYTAAREELGYAPKYTLESGLKDYIEWARLNT